jgi:hypothetical protein
VSVGGDAFSSKCLPHFLNSRCNRRVETKCYGEGHGSYPYTVHRFFVDVIARLC